MGELVYLKAVIDAVVTVEEAKDQLYRIEGWFVSNQ
jgi:hypothetical protein